MVLICGNCRFLFRLVELKLETFRRLAIAVVMEGRAAIITAQHVFTFRRRCLLRVLTVADLPQKSLVAELGLDFTLFLTHGALVQEFVRFLL